MGTELSVLSGTDVPGSLPLGTKANDSAHYETGGNVKTKLKPTRVITKARIDNTANEKLERAENFSISVGTASKTNAPVYNDTKRISPITSDSYTNHPVHNDGNRSAPVTANSNTNHPVHNEIHRSLRVTANSNTNHPVHNDANGSVPVTAKSNTNHPVNNDANGSVPVKANSNINHPVNNDANGSVPVTENSNTNHPVQNAANRSVPVTENSNTNHPVNNDANRSVPVTEKSNTYHPVHNDANGSVPVTENSNTNHPVHNAANRSVPVTENSNTNHPVNNDANRSVPVTANSNTYHPVHNDGNRSVPVTADSNTNNPVHNDANGSVPVTTNSLTNHPVHNDAIGSVPVTANLKTNHPVNNDANGSVPVTSKSNTNHPVHKDANRNVPVKANSNTNHPVNTDAYRNVPVKANSNTNHPVNTDANRSVPVTANSKTNHPVNNDANGSVPVTAKSNTNHPVHKDANRNVPVKANSNTNHPVNNDANRSVPVTDNSNPNHPVHNDASGCGELHDDISGRIQRPVFWQHRISSIRVCTAAESVSPRKRNNSWPSASSRNMTEKPHVDVTRSWTHQRTKRQRTENKLNKREQESQQNIPVITITDERSLLSTSVTNDKCVSPKPRKGQGIGPDYGACHKRPERALRQHKTVFKPVSRVITISDDESSDNSGQCEVSTADKLMVMWFFDNKDVFTETMLLPMETAVRNAQHTDELNSRLPFHSGGCMSPGLSTDFQSLNIKENIIRSSVNETTGQFDIGAKSLVESPESYLRSTSLPVISEFDLANEVPLATDVFLQHAPLVGDVVSDSENVIEDVFLNDVPMDRNVLPDANGIGSDETQQENIRRSHSVTRRHSSKPSWNGNHKSQDHTTVSLIETDNNLNIYDISESDMSIDNQTEGLADALEDPELTRAAIDSITTEKITPLLKHELKHLIHLRRFELGLKAESTRNIEEEELPYTTAAGDKKRWERKRALSKESAQRCRERQHSHETYLLQTYRKLESTNRDLKIEIEQLIKEQEELDRILNRHCCVKNNYTQRRETGKQ